MTAKAIVIDRGGLLEARTWSRLLPLRYIAMSVDAATVKRIARLARIRIDDEEVERYQQELNVILGFVEQLNEVDVDGVEPMTSVMPMQLRRRDDAVRDGGYAERIVANSPLSEDNFFMVPKVVE